jgi:hypothetical protein
LVAAVQRYIAEQKTRQKIRFIPTAKGGGLFRGPPKTDCRPIVQKHAVKKNGRSSPQPP